MDLTDSGATTIVLEDAGHRAEFEAAPSAAGVRAFQITGGDGPGAIEELTALGAQVGDDEVAARRTGLRSADPGCSSIPPAPPDGPRAASSPMPTCSPNAGPRCPPASAGSSSRASGC